MIREPLVSIAIPAYNVSRYIDECLQSVFRQSYSNVEVIIVNDGSTDDTEEAIRASGFFDNIRYIKQNNAGVSEARNRALESATGEYILFIDADDIVDTRYVEVLLGNISGVAVSICSHADFYDGESPDTPFSYKSDVTELGRDNLLAEVLYGDKISSGPHGKMFSASVAKGLVFDTSIRVGEDLDYIVRVCDRPNLKARYTSSKLYGYRRRQGSAMNSRYSSVYRQYYDVARRIYGNINGANPRIKKAASYRLFGVSSFCISISDSDDDNREYMSGINDTKFNVVHDRRSSVKNKILAMSYIINSRLTNYLRFKLW